MNDTIDVKNIFDIPNFEDYADELFSFNCYDVGDSTLIYSYSLDKLYISVEIIAEDIQYVFFREELLELATMDNIKFFQMTFRQFNEIPEGVTIEKLYENPSEYCLPDVKSYHYRPLVDESDKNYE